MAKESNWMQNIRLDSFSLRMFSQKDMKQYS
ncbi:hypothetical protein B23_2256 [Geobacillus thermoleovorans B23]|nr:hypothetical protein B23_2256 [Geobacillus thermoleovorans B23]